MNQRTLFDFDRPPALPTPPYAADSETSKAAAEAIKPRAAAQRARVLALIRQSGEEGITDDEGEARLGMTSQSYTPRRGELVKLGAVRDSGRQRRTRSGRLATVWVATAELLETPLRASPCGPVGDAGQAREPAAWPPAGEAPRARLDA